MKRTIVPRGILALSLAVVLLAATASTAPTSPMREADGSRARAPVAPTFL